MGQTLEVIERVAQSLPRLDSGESVEQQARATLSYVLEPILAEKFRPAEPIPENPITCPNCGEPSDSTKTPYCGPTCRNVAAFVRQFRGALADGSIFDPERQEALGQVLWYLLGGGRPLRQHIIPERTRKDLFKKAGGRCAICGAEATTIDHIASGCNRPINLRAVCDSCCRTKPFGDASVVGRPEFTELLDEFVTRVGSPDPIRCCDDPKNWDWRQYIGKRK